MPSKESGTVNRITPSSLPDEIIAFIHGKAAEAVEAARDGMPRATTWDVCTREEQVNPSFAAERKRWSDAAYEGNWGEILSIIAEHTYDLGMYANATRLLPRDIEIDPLRSPSGFTVLHQAAYLSAPPKIIKALVAAGSFRRLHTLESPPQTPYEIASSRSFSHLLPFLAPPPDLLPHISKEEMESIQGHFEMLVKEVARGLWKDEDREMRIVPLELLREVHKIWMPVPGMYGGFSLRFEDDHLVAQSWCRVVDGSGRTNHVKPDGVKLVDSGW